MKSSVIGILVGVACLMSVGLAGATVLEATLGGQNSSGTYRVQVTDDGTVALASDSVLTGKANLVDGSLNASDINWPSVTNAQMKSATAVNWADVTGL